MDAGPRLISPPLPSQPTSRYRLLSQIVSGIPDSSLPSISLECDESLEEEPRHVEAPCSAVDEFRDLKYDYSQSDLQELFTLTQTQLDLLHSRFSPRARAILLDWMSEVCADYKLTRATYYLAASFVTRFFLSCRVEKTVFQLVGVAALSLAAKAEEERVPKMERLRKSCDGIYKVEDIKSMEQKLLGVLEWRFDTVTAVNILQWLMARWDIFLLSNYPLLPGEDDAKWVTFTLWTPVSKIRLLESFRLLDTILLHPESLKHPLLLTLTLFYLLVSHYFEETKYALLQTFGTADANSSLSLCMEVTSLFEGFLRQVVQKTAEELYPAVQFLLPFFCLLPLTETDSEVSQSADEIERKTWAVRQRHYKNCLQLAIALQASSLKLCSS